MAPSVRIHLWSHRLIVNIPLCAAQVDSDYLVTGSNMPYMREADTGKCASPAESHRQGTDIGENHVTYSLTTYRKEYMHYGIGILVWN